MSTVFAVYVGDGAVPEEDTENMIPVARRVGSGMYFINSISKLLPDDVKVYPVDNTAQGIYTIGDIRKATK